MPVPAVVVRTARAAARQGSLAQPRCAMRLFRSFLTRLAEGSSMVHPLLSLFPSLLLCRLHPPLPTHTGISPRFSSSP
eukprot:scaffold326198_cov67-Tisochrysis_lutea.AAC.1